MLRERRRCAYKTGDRTDEKGSETESSRTLAKAQMRDPWGETKLLRLRGLASSRVANNCSPRAEGEDRRPKAGQLPFSGEGGVGTGHHLRDPDVRDLREVAAPLAKLLVGAENGRESPSCTGGGRTSLGPQRLRRPRLHRGSTGLFVGGNVTSGTLSLSIRKTVRRRRGLERKHHGRILESPSNKHGTKTLPDTKQLTTNTSIPIDPASPALSSSAIPLAGLQSIRIMSSCWVEDVISRADTREEDVQYLHTSAGNRCIDVTSARTIAPVPLAGLQSIRIMSSCWVEDVISSAYTREEDVQYLHTSAGNRFRARPPPMQVHLRDNCPYPRVRKRRELLRSMAEWQSVGRKRPQSTNYTPARPSLVVKPKPGSRTRRDSPRRYLRLKVGEEERDSQKIVFGHMRFSVYHSLPKPGHTLRGLLEPSLRSVHSAEADTA
ncbi:hypothetical protein LXA43DRAFT_1068646 [Ganoderma leucocontextum]|nr:hypothetical protein LXA43DRAFT_1068646 [Ganoderma leucocontextum]